MENLLVVYYMRDNHTFRRLNSNVEDAIAQIRDEWDEGYTGGMLCSKSKVAPAPVHGYGRDKWREFELDVRAWYATLLSNAELTGSRRASALNAVLCGADLEDGMNEPTQEQFGDVLTAIAAMADAELMALEESELAARWYWRWEEGRSIEWNTYKFSDALEMHKLQCRRWEERHNGRCCVVERVRDKYLMPRVREFLAALATHNVEAKGPSRLAGEGPA